MTRRHDDVFNDVLSGLDADSTTPNRPGTRFLKRSTTIADRLSGEVEEKTLRWIDPSQCRMWAQHNRDYALLNEETCRDLIDGLIAQGKQEFPAIVRATDDPDHPFEVICGARRHFAVSWLRANTYPQFKFLIEVRDLTDEEAFRLADIENRDREDISDYERALDYADAISRYYGGKQRAMANRLEVSESWLSRFLSLANLPDEVVAAFPSIRDIRERSIRDLKPLLAVNATRRAVIAVAQDIATQQNAARNGQGAFMDPADVIRRLLAASKPVKPRKTATVQTYGGTTPATRIEMRKKGRKTMLEFDQSMSESALKSAFQSFIAAQFRKD